MSLTALDVGKFLTHYLHIQYREGVNEGYETGYDEGFKEGTTLKVLGKVITVNSFGDVL